MRAVLARRPPFSKGGIRNLLIIIKNIVII